VNIPLLHRLRAGGGAFVPWPELGPGAEAGLAELEAFGFGIERHPRAGAAYRGPAAGLCPDQIEWELGSKRVGRRIAVWRKVASTNDLAMRAAGSAANDGLVVLAEEQTAGRGRWGRTWTAPAGSALLMSVLLHPPGALADPAWMTAWGAVAVAEVVEAWTGRRSRIKWPNDVRVGGRKVAGILVERGAGAGAVVGIGLNALAGPGDFPAELLGSATSLAMLAPGRPPVDRSELARSLILRLDAWYAEGLGRGPAALNAAWKGRLERLGEPVRVQTPGGLVAGRWLDADPGGGLIIEPEAGAIRRIAGAEALAVTGPDAGPARPVDP